MGIYSSKYRVRFTTVNKDVFAYNACNIHRRSSWKSEKEVMAYNWYVGSIPLRRYTLEIWWTKIFAQEHNLSVSRVGSPGFYLSIFNLLADGLVCHALFSLLFQMVERVVVTVSCKNKTHFICWTSVPSKIENMAHEYKSSDRVKHGNTKINKSKYCKFLLI